MIRPTSRLLLTGTGVALACAVALAGCSGSSFKQEAPSPEQTAPENTAPQDTASSSPSQQNTMPDASSPAPAAPSTRASRPQRSTPPAAPDADSATAAEDELTSPETWKQYGRHMLHRNDEVSEILAADRAGCLDRGIRSWNQHCLDLLDVFSADALSYVRGLDESVGAYGKPRTTASRKALGQASGSMDYSYKIATHAVDEGCLSVGDPQRKIERMKGDGVMVSCVDHFTPLYFERYTEALRTIAENG